MVTKVKDGPHKIDMFYWLSINALESIGQAGLGYSLENAENETPYAKAIKDTPSVLFVHWICSMFTNINPLLSPIFVSPISFVYLLDTHP